MISLGKKPNLKFKVQAHRTGKTEEVPFCELIEGPTLVSVYMRNNTSSCDLQNAELGKNMQAIAKQGFKIISVSRDTCTSHAKYAAKHGYKFDLVSDPEDQFAKAVDGIVEKSMYGKKYQGPARAAYIFDGKGKLIAIVAKVEAATHGRQLLDAMAGLK